MQQSDPKKATSAPSSNTEYLLSGLHLISAQKRNAPGAIPSIEQCAFFLDLDGTLIDIAPRPDAVVVESGLKESLIALEKRTSGALAIVSGRSIDFIDQLFEDYLFTAAGLHGAEIRHARNGISDAGNAALAEAKIDAKFAQAYDFAHQAAAKCPDLLFEDKGRAFALHYRLTPSLEPLVTQIMRTASELAGNEYVLQDGKFVSELKPCGSNKGTAVSKLMQADPFCGKYPIAAGDDITDEAMFEVVNASDGLSLRIGPLSEGRKTQAHAQADTPSAFRKWIRSLTQ